MPALNDRVFDSGLVIIDNETTALHILSADPGLTYANIATYTLGNKSAPAIAAPADRSGGGRQVTVSAITDGSVTANGTASHYALIDATNSRILASGALSATQVVTSGNTFTLTQFIIGIPDPV